MNTPLSQCHALLGAKQCSAACQTHIRCTLNWTAAGRQGEREAEKERGRMEDGREGAKGGWEQGNTREGGRGGREGRAEAMMIGSERASV